MKKIYISTSANGEPTAVIMAEEIRDARIALMSMKADAHAIEEIDPLAMNNDTTPVVFLLTSTEANSLNFSHRLGGVDFRIWKRGL